MNQITRFFYDILISKNIPSDIAEIINVSLNTILLLITLILVDVFLIKVYLYYFKLYAKRSKNNFDDYLVKNKTIEYIIHGIPLFIIIWILPDLFIAFPTAEKYLEVLFDIMIIILTIWIIRSLLRTFRDFLKSLSSFKDKPIDSYIQVFMIIIWSIGGIFIFSSVTGKPVLTFLTALGAMSAVILLIFKDTILGFVSSIQVAVNDTVRIGDWISMDKYGADGDVIEINLASVKVQNFDKTITTIPTYNLTSESFRNWRGMVDSGGRRIKRALYIKPSSISFLTNDQINELQKIKLLNDYLSQTAQQIQTYNAEQNIDKSILINGRNLTNLGVFRKYIEVYLLNHPQINTNMTVMSRQLAPSNQGIPLEIYAFSNDKIWKNYENIVGDIFDHLLASIPYFDLELFEFTFEK